MEIMPFNQPPISQITGTGRKVQNSSCMGQPTLTHILAADGFSAL
jgi:hypothetical protein